MGIEFGLTTGLVNTKYAPLAALIFRHGSETWIVRLTL